MCQNKRTNNSSDTAPMLQRSDSHPTKVFYFPLEAMIEPLFCGKSKAQKRLSNKFKKSQSKKKSQKNNHKLVIHKIKKKIKKKKTEAKVRNSWTMKNKL